MSVESGLAALRSGRLAEARRVAESCLAGQPDDMAARHLLARVHEASGDLEKALSVNGSVDPIRIPGATRTVPDCSPGRVGVKPPSSFVASRSSPGSQGTYPP